MVGNQKIYYQGELDGADFCPRDHSVSRSMNCRPVAFKKDFRFLTLVKVSFDTGKSFVDTGKSFF